jgi:hypothetical protein
MRGLRHYVDQYRFRWACRDCLTRTLSREAPGQGPALERLRHRWWDEAHGDQDVGGLDTMIDGFKGVGQLQGMGQDIDPKDVDPAKVQQMVDDFMKAFQ